MGNDILSLIPFKVSVVSRTVFETAIAFSLPLFVLDVCPYMELPMIPFESYFRYAASLSLYGSLRLGADLVGITAIMTLLKWWFICLAPF